VAIGENGRHEEEGDVTGGYDIKDRDPTSAVGMNAAHRAGVELLIALMTLTSIRVEMESSGIRECSAGERVDGGFRHVP
jgi:hypothetical protein